MKYSDIVILHNDSGGACKFCGDNKICFGAIDKRDYYRFRICSECLSKMKRGEVE